MACILVTGVVISSESLHEDTRVMGKEDESTRLEDVGDAAGGTTTSGGATKPAGTRVTY